MHHGTTSMTHLPSPISDNKDDSGTTFNSWNKSFLKIGHGGASGHALANTLHSLSLALEMGVDVVEFDVRPCNDALVLLHDDNLSRYHYPDSLASQSTLEQLRTLEIDPKRQIATLEEALDLIKGHALMNIDLKAAGYETSVLELVCAKGVLGDVIFSSVIPSSLQRIRQQEPGAMIGLSYPEDRGDASSQPYLKPLVNTVLAVMRLTLPYRVVSMMANAGANAVMLYHKIITRSVIRVVQQAGGKVFTWTVDDLARIQTLQKLGVNGITTNFPNLFNPGNAFHQ
jgi:glycerophosphoryl diester phosphodiesterase